MSTKFNLCLRCASHISKSSAVQGSCVSSYLFILAVQNVLLTTMYNVHDRNKKAPIYKYEKVLSLILVCIYFLLKNFSRVYFIHNF